jgi:predicted GIY-YIG superfamily endonuclease
MPHYTYIVRCADHTLYTGYTNNLDRRIKRHNAKRGAKYTAGRLPVKLVYFEKFATLNAARKREVAIQSWRKKMKENLIKNGRRIKKTNY